MYLWRKLTPKQRKELRKYPVFDYGKAWDGAEV
jgi:hypothetical protein